MKTLLKLDSTCTKSEQHSLQLLPTNLLTKAKGRRIIEDFAYSGHSAGDQGTSQLPDAKKVNLTRAGQLIRTEA